MTTWEILVYIVNALQRQFYTVSRIIALVMWGLMVIYYITIEYAVHSCTLVWGNSS